MTPLRVLFAGFVLLTAGGLASPVAAAEPAAPASPTAAATPLPPGPLDGKKFKVQMWEKAVGKAKSEADSLIFAQGAFRSTGCDEYGFKPTAYQSRTKEGRVRFEALAKSPKEGVMKWSGKFSKGKISGQARWTKPGQPAIEYEFEGTPE